MKKLFAILLIIAMLIPMGVMSYAEEPAKKPFLMVNWGVLPHDDYTNVYNTPYFWTNPGTIAQGVASSYAPALGATAVDDYTELAEALKDLFDTYPEGARHINFNMVATAVHALADVCFEEKVPPVVAPWVDGFMKEYKRIGGKLDGMIIDVEYLPISNYYIHSEFYTKDPLVYDKIVNDPAYKEKIRPQLVERGFKFYSPATKETPEIYSIHPKSGAEYAASRAIWDIVMYNYQADIITECCAPVWKYYPDAVVSDYTARDSKPWVVASSGGIRETPGNASNENFYSYRPSTTFFVDHNEPVYNTIKTRVDAVFENNAFNRFIYEANTAKNIYLSADEDVSWWFAHAYYEENINPYVHTPYYSELVFHTSLLDPAAIYGYILDTDCKSKDPDDGKWYQDGDKYEAALKIADDCLRQVSDIVGYADRKPIAVDANWNHSFVLSGMYANGKNYWRITPDDNEIKLEDFKVKDATDPTFAVNGETVTFPGGKIIEDAKVHDVGTYGYWVETAADVMPVITRVAEYFRVNAAYQETFEKFEAGMEYSYDNAKPAACWENKKQGTGSAVVIADPADANNKVLEIKGGYLLKNVTLPKNIQSGDHYAKHQAWEVTVTIPSDVAEDDEMILLNAVPEKKKGKDTGFKVVGTKVYYDQKGEYVEMPGVTLTAGAKYTFIRDFDFTTADAFTCDYYVYDAEGKVVGKAKKIATVDMDIPVYSVSMSIKNPSGAAVLLDDYKLYPTKVTTDFYTYNAKTGIQVAEGESVDGNVAYRLSWLNATQSEKSYSLMAAYYDGDTKVSEEVVQEFKLPANGDRIDTGVVENKQPGKKMVVYLRDNNPAEEDDVTVGGDDNKNTDDGAKLDPMIIIIAAAAVLVVVVVVVVIVVASKKKKAKVAVEAAPEAEKTEEPAPVAEEPAENEEPKEE